jgi:hypothetical protein
MNPENWNSESVADQCNRLTEIVEKHQARAAREGLMDIVMFWEGYNAMLQDIRYCGLILLTDHLEQRLNNHYG